MKNINDLFAKAAQLSLSVPNGSGAGNSKPSFGIVCSKKSGVRMHLSGALTKQLGLTDYLELNPADENTLLIGRNLGMNNALGCKLKEDEGRRIAYATGICKALISFYGLDFSNGRTSRSFDKIEIVTAPNGEPAAAIKMKNGVPMADEAEENEEM